MPDNNVGIIHEQGFPAGEGLGFNPLSESDKGKLNQDTEEKDENQKKG